MKIIVLVKQVPDTWGERKLTKATGQLDRSASDAVIDEIDERALEVALQYKDAQDAEVIALSMGPSSVTEMLRKSLAMGADSALHVQDDALSGSDLSRTAAVLAAAIAKSGFDIVIAGNEATDGRGGVIPAMIAEHLGTPSMTYLDSVAITSDGVSGVRADEHGTVAVHAALPAVISITEASAEPRFPNFRGIMKAKKKPLDVWSLADLGLDDSGFAPSTVVVNTTERPARTAGTKNIDEGNAGNEIAEFLAAGRLI
ncbi:electron transfer flavoprotein subunit beta/FixA family protein [Arthrobacter sp. PAMC25564]|uniref:electron transfer flavoprotein subunit beta/FixA family protein n=1 Tax=Arthrobacter sp. PAMC25564 TaxID=2565366 RepID=UPI0010A2375E|nr:electron transfer flavoprotein subunit beta/FixA family protein [Arthrobacter sp. PAMC25564]QCB97952.1 electron transfer flavoprotein subunit beta/FixA family protein [Arthrobacter sp. PAMC25564]